MQETIRKALAESAFDNNLVQVTNNLDLAAILLDFLPEIQDKFLPLCAAFTAGVSAHEQQLTQHTQKEAFKDLTEDYELLEGQLSFANAVRAGDQLPKLAGDSFVQARQSIVKWRSAIVDRASSSWKDTSGKFEEVYSELSTNSSTADREAMTAQLVAMIQKLQVFATLQLSLCYEVIMLMVL